MISTNNKWWILYVEDNLNCLVYPNMRREEPSDQTWWQVILRGKGSYVRFFDTTLPNPYLLPEGTFVWPKPSDIKTISYFVGYIMYLQLLERLLKQFGYIQAILKDPSIKSFCTMSMNEMDHAFFLEYLFEENMYCMVCVHHNHMILLMVTFHSFFPSVTHVTTASARGKIVRPRHIKVLEEAHAKIYHIFDVLPKYFRIRVRSSDV